MSGLFRGFGDSEFSNARESFINLNPYRGCPGSRPSPDGAIRSEREASAVTVREVPVQLVIKELVVRNSVTEPGQTDDAAHQETWGERDVSSLCMTWSCWRDRV